MLPKWRLVASFAFQFEAQSSLEKLRVYGDLLTNLRRLADLDF